MFYKFRWIVRVIIVGVIGFVGLHFGGQLFSMGNANVAPTSSNTAVKTDHQTPGSVIEVNRRSVTGSTLPAYKTGSEAIILNGNVPTFKVGSLAKAYVHNTLLDHNRPGVMNAVLTKANRFIKTRAEVADPHQGRESNPAGWHSLKLANGTWLYNRSHLLGFAMANFSGYDYSEYNQKNVITGTEAFNQDTTWGMNHWEGIVRNALAQNKVVRYQVEPLYKAGDLLPRAVHMQAKSGDASVQFNVVVYNVEPGFGSIDYHTGALMN